MRDMRWLSCLVACVISIGLMESHGSVTTYGDAFTLASGNDYGAVYGTIPTNVPPSGETAIEWKKTTRPGWGHSFIIEDAGGEHGGVLRANDLDTSTGTRVINYAENIDLSQTVAFNNGGEKNVLWSITFDMNRNGNTYNWFWIYANYDDATGNGLGILFNFGGAQIKFIENGVESETIGNPGLVMGSMGNWASFLFERYDDGTIRIAKTSGGQAGAGGDFDVTLALSNSNYPTGGTIAVGILANTGTPNPLYIDNLKVVVAAIPEPGTVSLLALVALGAMVYRRRS